MLAHKDPELEKALQDRHRFFQVDRKLSQLKNELYKQIPNCQGSCITIDVENFPYEIIKKFREFLEKNKEKWGQVRGPAFKKFYKTNLQIKDVLNYLPIKNKS